MLLEVETREESPTLPSKVSLVLGFQILLLTTDYTMCGDLKKVCCVRYKANIKYYFWFGYKETRRRMGTLYHSLRRKPPIKPSLLAK